MEYQDYIIKKKEMIDGFHQFIEDENNSEDLFQQLLNIINSQKIEESRYEFKMLLLLINKVSNNHYRYPLFIEKIEQIILNFKEKIQQYFTNSEIFEIFDGNKRILQFLFEKGIVIVDEAIAQMLKHHFIDQDNIVFRDYSCSSIKSKKGNRANKNLDWQCYFYPEIKPFLDENEKSRIEKKLQEQIQFFEENRKVGENESYICQLIRQDSIEEFDKYINKINLPLSSKIKKSFFETNSFLIDKQPTLIEYAAFFGSIQIFHYLRLKFVESSPSLWLYAIHSNNPEMIHLLEDNHIEPENKNYMDSLKESIKCHHNEIAIYIKENLMNENCEFNENNIFENLAAYGFHYHNYNFIQDMNNHQLIFYYACLYDYFPINFDIDSLNLAAQKNNVEIVQLLLSCPTKKIDENCFIYCQKLKKISIPSSITLISNYAFQGCISLAQVSIPSSVKEIGKYAFSECRSLSKISIPSSITKIGVNAFELCTSLNRVTFEEPSSLTKILESTFYKCQSLEEISIPPSVTSIGQYIFSKCASLKKVIIPSSVTSIERNSFYYCTSLKDINIPPSITSIDLMAFSNCSSLEKMFIPYVQKIESYAFSDCTSLKEVALSPPLTVINNYMFSKCSSLAQISIPPSVTLIGEFSFYKCTSLKSVEIPSSVTSIERSAFNGCSSLINVIIPSSVTKIDHLAFNNCISLTKISIPSSVERIDYNSFNGCSSLEQITIPTRLVNEIRIDGGVEIIKV